MAQFTAKKIDITKINGGEQIASGSGVTPELLNAPVNSALYTEKAIEILTNQVDVSEIDGTGAPNVEFRTVTNGQETYKYLKFKNLKGERGEQGNQGAGGKDGRGIKKVSQSGNDLVIEYDDGTTQTMVGAIEALTELPIVSATDTGKILVVNQDGKWSVGDAPQSGGKNIQSIVIEGTSFIVTYIDGSVETVEIDTQNTVVAVPEGVAGGGVSDVQVNGTSVVTDGVANIPAASVSQAGVVTTGDQTIDGNKTFKKRIYIGEVPAREYAISSSNSTGGLLFYGVLSTYPSNYIFAVASNMSQAVTLNPYGGVISIVDGGVSHGLKKSTTQSGNVTSTLPTYDGILMSAPSTWSEGVSGTAQLPEVGTYQIVAGNSMSWIVRWRGTGLAYSPITLTNAIGDYHRITISMSGVITVKSGNIGSVGTENDETSGTYATVQFRKIGIV